MARGRVKDRDGICRRKDRTGWWPSWVDASGKRRKRKLEAHRVFSVARLLRFFLRKPEQFGESNGWIAAWVNFTIGKRENGRNWVTRHEKEIVPEAKRLSHAKAS
jgi:hypothetical protein